MSDFSKINVNEHVEKKNGLSYLSWAWAWTEVLRIDPQATWEAVEFNGMPVCYLKDDTAIVKTAVTINGHTKTCWLPVMDHRNKAIPNPNAFDVNKAIVRCLTKTISMFGLGLYIYAGEDLPPIDNERIEAIAADIVNLHEEQNTIQACETYWSASKNLNNEEIEYLWSQLRDYSALRSAIKANKPQQKAA